MTARVVFALTLTSALVACGGGGASEDPPKAPSGAAPATSLLAIGNSLTFVAAGRAVGWDHDSGMAASDAAHDYVHLAASGLNLPVKAARYEASIERNPAAPVDYLDMATPLQTLISQATAGIDSRTAVVVELGDNVLPGGDGAFAASYGQLLDAVTSLKPRSLVCLSTWWEVASRDDMMKAACRAHGGTFVYIGDIFPVRIDTPLPGEDPATSVFWTHPHDASMLLIAARVRAALTP